MKKNKQFYWKLFFSTFSLSAFTFGGGYVIVPLMQKRFVKELKWIDEDEMMDLVAISQSAPGPLAINASIIVGYKMAGIPGALLTAFGTVLPPLITITIISFFYLAFRDNMIIQGLMKGMQAGVAAVIVDVVINMAAKIIKIKKILPTIVMVLSFIVATLLKVNIVYILLISGALGAYTVFRSKHPPGSNTDIQNTMTHLTATESDNSDNAVHATTPQYSSHREEGTD